MTSPYSFIAICEFELPQRTAGDLEKILRPEVQGEGDRTSVGMEKEGDRFVLKVGSRDIKGLRAGLNSYLRWIECSLNVTKLPK
jgi:tRNA threonylcarbamoyladenosine modification (KEOPS) complex  Pcc1 subunit